MTILIALIGGLIFVAALWLGFIVLRRTVRLVFKLAMAGVMILLLVVGAIVLWWSFSANSASPKAKTQPAIQRTNTR